MTGIRVSARMQLPNGQNSRGQAVAIVSLLSPLPTHSNRTATLCLRFQSGLHRLHHPGDYLRLLPIQLISTLFYKAALQRESNQLYLTHKNKHREAAKMRRQGNMSQIKEQNKTPEKELNDKEISTLSHAEFKTLVIRMLKELTGYFNSKKRPRQK